MSAPAEWSRVCAVVSDVHFDQHDVAAWGAFRRWHGEVCPKRTVLLGDMIDFGMLSQFAQGADDPVYAIPQIKVFVREANALAEEAGAVTVVNGNHDDRWSKMLGSLAQKLRGAIGFTLEEQCRAQGLDPRVQWVTEDTLHRGVQLGPFVLRHGHRQAGRFGVKHIAANRLSATMGDSEIVGHHHRVQMMAKTAGGRVAVSIANGHMTKAHEYAPDADWQQGFTVVELYDDDRAATAYPVIMRGGAFAWGGRVWRGEPAPVTDEADTDHGVDVDLSALSEPESPRVEARSIRGRRIRAPRLLTAFGRTQTLADWAREYGLHASAIGRRIDNGWDVERAISTPSTAQFPRDKWGRIARAEPAQEQSGEGDESWQH